MAATQARSTGAVETPARPVATPAQRERPALRGCATAQAVPAMLAHATARVTATSFNRAASIATRKRPARSIAPGGAARGFAKAWPATFRASVAVHSTAPARPATSTASKVAAKPPARWAPIARPPAQPAVAPPPARAKERTAASTVAGVAAGWSARMARLATSRNVEAAARWIATAHFAPSTNAAWVAPLVAMVAEPARSAAALTVAATCSGSPRRAATRAPPWSSRRVLGVPATSTVERSTLAPWVPAPPATAPLPAPLAPTAPAPTAAAA